MLSEEELSRKYERMIKLLSMKPYGLFHWLEELVGSTRAVELAMEKSIPYPGTTASSSSLKRREASGDADSDHDEATKRTQPRRRL